MSSGKCLHCVHTVALHSDIHSTAMGLSTSLDNPMSAFLNLIPELSRSDANTELFFLSSNDIQFLNATDDPWFSAHQPNLVEVQEFKDETGESQQVRLASYAADSPISVIGCASSIQVCDSNKPVSIGCSSLQGMPSRWSIDFDRALEAPGTQEQVTLFKAFSSFANLGSQYLSTIVQELGATALQARQSLVVGQQSKLPADQWQIEMRQFFATFLAYQQQLVVDAVAGPAPNLPAEYHLPPGTDGKRMLCKSQVKSHHKWSPAIRLIRIIESTQHRLHVLLCTRTLAHFRTGWPSRSDLLYHGANVYVAAEAQEMGQLCSDRVDHE